VPSPSAWAGDKLLPPPGTVIFVSPTRGRNVSDDPISRAVARDLLASLRAELAAELGDDPVALLRLALDRSGGGQHGGAPLSVKQVAARVGREHQAVRRAIKRGDLLGHKIGGEITIFEADYSAWLDKCAIAPSRPRPSARMNDGPMRQEGRNGLKRLLDAGDREA
jgi:hypothetical protein